MDFLAIFISWQFLLLCVSIAAVTFIIRTLTEYLVLDNPKLPGNSKAKAWRDGALVLLPVFLGILFPFVAKTFTYPEVLVEPYSKFLFCLAAGLLSPTLYRVIKAQLWKNAGVDPNPPQQNFFPTPPPGMPVIPPCDPPADPPSEPPVPTDPGSNP